MHVIAETATNYGASSPWKLRRDDIPAHLSILEKLMMLRGVSGVKDTDEFLVSAPHIRLPELLSNPLDLPDARVAAERVASAVERGERICVYGDYDADGVTSTAILLRGLRQLGADVLYYIPHRIQEGFGLHTQAVRSLAESGVRLIITCDCGTADLNEVWEARELGVDVIITDHHQASAELPDAIAVVNPSRPDSRYPFRGLTGAGVAYQTLRAIAYQLASRHMNSAGALMQLAALGTVADVGILRGENRTLVRAGLNMLNTTPTPGLRALITVSRLTVGRVSEEDIAFHLAPRLNSAGRMAHANLACDLLTEGASTRARAMAQRLDSLNQSRKAETAEMMAYIQQNIPREELESGEPILVNNPDWSPALLGIIAGRLSGLYSVPAIAACGDGETSRASVRSVAGFDIMQVLSRNSSLMIEHGGHSQAAGFTVKSEDLQSVYQSVKQSYERPEEVAVPVVDLELRAEDMDMDLSRALMTMSPYGAGNEEFTFGFRDVPVGRVRTFGKASDHLSFTIPGGLNREVEVVGFGLAGRERDLIITPRVSLIARPLRQRDGSFFPLRLNLDEIFL